MFSGKLQCNYVDKRFVIELNYCLLFPLPYPDGLEHFVHGPSHSDGKYRASCRHEPIDDTHSLAEVVAENHQGRGVAEGSTRTKHESVSEIQSNNLKEETFYFRSCTTK